MRVEIMFRPDAVADAVLGAKRLGAVLRDNFNGPHFDHVKHIGEGCVPNMLVIALEDGTSYLYRTVDITRIKIVS